MRRAAKRAAFPIERPFSNERELQQFVENHAAALLGVRVVASSCRGGSPLGHIDTLALDADHRPVILEYKRDWITPKTVAQIVRYAGWLESNWTEVQRALKGRGVSAFTTASATLILIGYRMDPALSDDQSARKVGTLKFLRYAYNDDKTAYLLPVSENDLKMWKTGRAVQAAPPRRRKNHYLPVHQARTTSAGRAAFDLLSRRLRSEGFEETIYGRNRVSYKDAGRKVHVSFLDIGLSVNLKAPDVRDPEGRAKRIEDRGGARWIVGAVSPGDVEYILRMLGVDPDRSGPAAGSGGRRSEGSGSSLLSDARSGGHSRSSRSAKRSKYG